ncbi:MAG: hypothetical protein ACLTS6_03625 [Anaerobutyricum sp.]
MKYISYTFTFVISIVGLLTDQALSLPTYNSYERNKEIPADTIGIEGNLAKRIESATAFKGNGCLMISGK